MAARSQKGVKGFIGADTTEDVSLGSQAWNVADGYTKLKILKNLILLDQLEIIAIHGTEGIDDVYLFTSDQIADRRQNALLRFISVLRQLLGNVKFAIKSGDKEKIDGYFQQITDLEPFLDGVSYVTEDTISHETSMIINEEHFRKIMNMLQRIKDEINFPINHAGLIFRESDEIDLDKMMEDIVQGG